MDHYEEISKSLNMLEKSKTGAVSLCKVQKVLQDCGYPLKEEELIYLLKRLLALPPALSRSLPPCAPLCTGLVCCSFSFSVYSSNL